MSLGRWILGAVAVGVALGASGAQAAPLPLAPQDSHGSVQMVQFFPEDEPQSVQFFFEDEPPPVYYEPAPRRYYRDYPPPRRDYYPPPPRAYYAPPPARYAPPPQRYAQPPRRVQPPRYGNNQAPQIYTKGQVRAWNKVNGF